MPGPPGGRGVHFVFFVGLGLLTAASRFPVRRGALAVVLLLYAIVTEASQAFVPSRTVDPIDALENVTGLVVGTLIWWIAWRRLCPLDGAADDDRGNQESGGRESRAGAGKTIAVENSVKGHYRFSPG